jgi:hypothetical protein
MRTKPGVDIKPSPGASSSVIQTFLSDLSADELKRVAVTVIREHRHRLEAAQELFEEINRLEASGADGGDLDGITHNYRIALLNMHAQHQLVGLVVERLGYVPEVDGQHPVLN